MNQDVMVIEGVSCYLDEEGTAWLNAEDVARGLGFVQTQIKNGKEYVSVRYERISQWLIEWGFPHRVGKKDFIPENMFYRLAMKANNETARKFQAKIADDVLPVIRKQGVYMTTEAAAKILYNPDFIINLAQQVKDANAKIAILQPKADYTDKVLQSPSTILTTTIGGVGRGAYRGSLSARIQRYRIRLWREKNLRGNSFPTSGDNLRGKNFSCRPRRFLRQKNLEKIISETAPRLPPNPDSTPPFRRSLAFVRNRQINNKSYLPMSSMIMTGFKSFSVSSCFETNKPLHFANNSNAFNTSLTAAGFVVNVPFGSTTVSSTSPFAIADSLSCTSSAVNIFSLVIASFNSFIRD